MRVTLSTWFLTIGLTIGGCDTVDVQNVDGGVGLFVDGADGDGPINDRARVGASTGSLLINVGNVSGASAPNRNEVIAFGRRRAPTRTDTPWTDDGDSFDAALGNQLQLPVTVWIVQGPFSEQRDHAIEACIRTAAIWDDERVGVRFSAFDIKNATNDPDIDGDILDSVGGDNRNWDDFSDEIGFDEGRINIYWINTVDGSSGMGWSDFGGRIVMGKNTVDTLLAHELGHAFSLRHPINCNNGPTADFDDSNVMWQCVSTEREFFTEGQVFRIHFNDESSVNALYNARAGEPTVDCIGSVANAECPDQLRRLWADGAFPAN